MSKQPKTGLGGYLGESLIYELDDKGTVVSMTSLPRLVNGSVFHESRNGVVWSCQGSQLLKLTPTTADTAIGMGPGGFDCLTTIAWLRKLTSSSQAKRKPWLRSGSTSRGVAFAGQYVFSTLEGGYVSEENGKLYEFPIEVTDPENGDHETLILKVPFSKPIHAPESNYSSSRGQIKTIGAYLVGIGNISLDGDRMSITFGSRESSKTMFFKLAPEKLDKLFGNATKTESEKEETVDVSGLTPLDAADDPDVRRLKQLLKEGANINERSNNGWSALMSASCYGNAKVVEFLIDNGANVDFADENCGGQTTLMWAARSSRSSKRKVKILIDAGADIWKKTDSGRDLLMSASGAGNIEVVELLLSLGMKPTTVSDSGDTALMSAARSESPQLIQILLDAGAQIDAADKEGKTALMYAANGYDNGQMVEALLACGAKPDLKDKESRTALDYCTDSNNFGANRRAEILKAAIK